MQRLCNTSKPLLQLFLISCLVFASLSCNLNPTYYPMLYDGNGNTAGSVPSDGTNHVAKATVMVIGNINNLMKSGYVFTGWNTEDDGSGTHYSSGDTFSMPAKPVMLHAQWEAIDYSITYVQDGGINHVGNPASYTIACEPITLGTPSRENHSFLGWFSDSALTTKVETISTGTTGNLTLYACWNRDCYAVYFHSNGGFGSLPKQTFQAKETESLQANGFTRPGHAFLGWSTTSSGSVEYVDGAPLTMETSDVQLYAMWEVSSYTITYVLDSGNNHAENPTNYTINSATIVFETPSKTHHHFQGWYAESSFTTLVETIPNGSTGSRTFFARWQLEKHALGFRANGGTNSMQNLQLSYGETATLPENLFVRVGYHCIGWATSAEGAVEYADGDSLTMGDSDITLYAKWAANADTAYQVEHRRQDVSGAGYTLYETQNLAGTTAATVEAVERTYPGFVQNTSHSGRKATGTVTADGGLVLELYYDRNTYTVDFVSNDGSAVSPLQNVRHGATISTAPAPTRAGYGFSGWYKEPALTNAWDWVTDTVTTNWTLYAKWAVKTDTAYQVKHYQQDASGDGYTLRETQDLTGTTEATVEAVARIYTGFVQNTGHADRRTSGAVVADGGLVLKLYYDRNTYTVDFNSNGGTAVNSQPHVRHGATVSNPTEPTRTGYGFDAWFKESALTNAWDFINDTATSNRTLYAKWIANADTAYQVEHYWQDAAGDGYTLYETQELTATTAVTVEAVERTYPGFVQNLEYIGRKASGSVAPQGSLVLKLFYRRNTCTVDFETNGGSVVEPVQNVRYGATLSSPAAPDRTGYAFLGWRKQSTLEHPWDFAQDTVTSDRTLYAKWAANTNTAYQVEHRRQDVSGAGYTLYETQNLAGTTAATMEAVERTYIGFAQNTSHADRRASGSVAADGTLVLKLYYDRDAYTVDFVSNGGSAVSPLQNVRHGATLSSPSAPTRAGYGFSGWYKEPALANAWDLATDTVTANGTLYAKWTANTDTGYTVEHYWQDVSGSGYTLHEYEDLEGTTDTSVSAIAKIYAGFMQNSDHTGRKASGSVASDGTLVLKLYYDRNTYRVDFESNSGTTVSSQLNVRYGATLSVPTAPTRTGYGFAGWYKESALANAWELATDTVTTDRTLYAKWTANANTAYRVEHHRQNVSGDGYTLHETQNLSGTTATTVDAVPKTYTGFVQNTSHNDRKPSGSVIADGSLVLKLYYDRSTYTVEFSSNGGSAVSSQLNVRYGATLSVPTAPTRTGYGFAGWYKESTLTTAWILATDTVTANGTLYAKWTANSNTAYKTEHYRQDVSGEGYALHETQNLTGTTAATVTASAKTYPGFAQNTSHADQKASGSVAAEGTLVLRLYYDRNTYTVDFNCNGGTEVSSQLNVRYGATVSEPSDPTRTGYAFINWYKESTFEYVWNFASDTVSSTRTLYAKWAANTDTAYKLEHYWQEISGSGYTLYETVDFTGTTGALVAAVAKTYTGFVQNTTYGDRRASGTVAADGTLVLRLYYDRKTYTVEFNSSGGTAPTVASKNIVFGSVYGTLPTTTKTGHTFDGWWTDAGGTGTQVSSATVVSRTENHHLYAKWLKNTYTITYDANGGTGSMLEQSLVFENSVALLPNDFTKTGYSFSGWAVSSTGVVVYANRATYTMGACDTNLFAIWTPDSHLVGFDTEGGSAAEPTSKQVTYDAPYGTLAQTQRDGYVFDGWWTGDGGTGTEVFSSTTVDTLENSILYAKWLVAYTVTFNSGEGSSVAAVAGVLPGSKIPAPASPTRAGYVFEGWYKESTCLNKWDFNADTVNTSLTLHAKWLVAYTVTFNSVEGTAVQAIPDVLHGAKITGPTPPTKSGYVFDGWYRESTYVNRWSFELDSVKANITLYAKWLAVYTVDFESAGGSPVASLLNVLTGSTLEEPAAITKEGSFFGGWYKESSFINRWDFDTDVVEADVTLFAKWHVITIGGLGPAGGLVFYAKSAYSDGWRYLEAAPASTEMLEKTFPGSFSGTCPSTIGTGENNTLVIVTAISSGDYATNLCYNLSHGGYDDWFLPSSSELGLMYTNLKMKGLGGFSNLTYWSSTTMMMSTTLNVRFQNFETGSVSYSSSGSKRSVRAVRAF